MKAGAGADILFILRITMSENAIIIMIMAITDITPISIICQRSGSMQSGPNIFINAPAMGRPAIIPTMPPITAKAMYLAAKSQRKLNESTPRAFIMPISFSSFLRSAIMVKRMVIKIISMRKRLTVMIFTLILMGIILRLGRMNDYVW